MKQKLNEFLDKMQIPAIILMLLVLFLGSIFAGSINKDNEELKEHREFRLEHLRYQNCKQLKQYSNEENR